MNFRSDS